MFGASEQRRLIQLMQHSDPVTTAQAWELLAALEPADRATMVAACVAARISLAWSELTDLDLSFGALRRGRFHRADLRRSVLHAADLRAADLSESHLQGADLSGARLQGADLSGAHLQGADLSRLQGHRACLQGAARAVALFA